MTHRTHDLSRIISLSGYLFNVNDVAPKDRGKHWVLLVHFNDEDSVFVCELERFDATLSVHTVCKKVPIQQVKEERHARRIYKIGETQVSEEELITLVENNEINDKKYNLISRNCQHWAQILIKDLDFPSLFQRDEELSDEENIVYHYEKFAGDHLGLQSDESVSLQNINKLKELADEICEIIKEDDDDNVNDTDKETIQNFIERNASPDDVDGEGNIDKNKMLAKIMKMVENETKDSSVIDKCKRIGSSFYRKFLSQDDTPETKPDENENPKLSPTSLKKVYKSFRNLALSSK